MLALAAPGAGLEVGELGGGVQVVLIALEHKADLVDVVAVELAALDHAVEEGRGIAHRVELLLRGALAGGVGLAGGQSVFCEGLAGKEAVVGLEVEAQAARVEPVDHALLLLQGDELVEDHRVAALDVVAVATDHAVQADVPDLLLVLGLGAAGAGVYLVTVGLRQVYGLHRGGRQVVLVVDERAVDIDEQELLVRHVRVLSRDVRTDKPLCQA